MGLGESDAEKQARRQQEAAFNQQQDLLNQQEQFLQQSNAQSTRILGLLEEAEAGNVASAELAQAELQRALEGNPTDAQLQFEEDIRTRAAEKIRRQLGPGGESSSAGIEITREAEEAIAASRDKRRVGDIQAAVQAGSLSQGTFNTNLQNQLIAATSPLTNTQALGQSVANLGKISQFNQPQRSTLLQDLGIGAITGLASSGNAIGNIGSNLGKIRGGLQTAGNFLLPGSPFGGGGGGFGAISNAPLAGITGPPTKEEIVARAFR